MAGIGPETQLAIRFLNRVRPDKNWLIIAKKSTTPGFPARLYTDIEKAGVWFSERNSEQYGEQIYWQVNDVATAPKTPKGSIRKASRDEITVVRYLQTDVDPKAIGAQRLKNRADIKQRFENLPIPPDVLIDSGNGYQGLWRITPIVLAPVGTPEREEQIRTIESRGKALGQLVGSDPVFDICRVLRVPYTTNWAPEGSTEKETSGANVVWENWDVEHSLEEFPEAEEPEGTLTDLPDGQTTELDFDVEDACAIRDDLRENSEILDLLPWRLGEKVRSGNSGKPGKDPDDRSSHLFEVICDFYRLLLDPVHAASGLNLGVTEELIYAIFSDPHWSISHHATVIKNSKRLHANIHKRVVHQMENARKSVLADVAAREAERQQAEDRRQQGKREAMDGPVILEPTSQNDDLLSRVRAAKSDRSARFNWKMKRDSKGNDTDIISSDAEQNVEVAIRDVLGIDLKFCKLRKTELLCNMPAGDYAEPDHIQKFGRPLTDDDIYVLRRVIRKELHFFPSEELIRRTIKEEARVQRIHPLIEYIREIPYTHEPENSLLETYLIRHCGAEDTPYNRWVQRAVPMAIIERAIEPGKKFDFMAVWEGGQGQGKSVLLKKLALFPEFLIEKLDLGESDVRLAENLKGKYLAEIAEMRGVDISPKAMNRLKSMLSVSSDRARTAYERQSADLLRTCVFVATSNPADYLGGDPTGYRRFVPIKLLWNEFTPAEEFEPEVPAIWAEAFHRVTVLRESSAMPKDLWDEAHRQRGTRMIVDAWADAVAEYLDEFDQPYSIWRDDIYTLLGIPIKDRNAKTNARVEELMVLRGGLKNNQLNRKGPAGKKVNKVGFDVHGGGELVVVDEFGGNGNQSARWISDPPKPPRPVYSGALGG